MNDDERVTKWYHHSHKNYYDVTIAATNVSYSLAGKKSEPKLFWATVIFTKLCTTSYTLLQILPNSQVSRHKISHWDFSSVATLGRNIIENYHTLFYLCFDEISEEEYQCRKQLFNLHDCISRKKVFSNFGNEDARDFDRTATELRANLEQNSIFKGFSEKRQRHLLKGDDAFYLIKDAIEEKIGSNVSQSKAMFNFFSNQTHTLPMSYYRMTEQKKRGTGVESEVDKGYIAMTLEYVSQYVHDATIRMIKFFPHVKETLDKKIIERIDKPLEGFVDSSTGS